MNRQSFLSAIGGAAVMACAPQARAQKAEPKYRDNLKRLAEWVAKSYVGGDIGLVPDLPSGKIHDGKAREDLKNLYWLQNCNLFSFYALRSYDKALAAKIEESYWSWYKKAFAECEERTEHYLAVGKLPKTNPPDGRFFPVVVKTREYNGYTVGTETFDASRTGQIKDNEPRGLLKFGVLGAQLRGEKDKARDYFRKAIALWDGAGFPDQKMGAGTRASYVTRYLPYALMAERAAHEKMPAAIKEAIESRLWSLQDSDGGVWTNFNADGSIPAIAKKTTEIGPLTLLAYDDRIWP